MERIDRHRNGQREQIGRGNEENRQAGRVKERENIYAEKRVDRKVQQRNRKYRQTREGNEDKHKKTESFVVKNNLRRKEKDGRRKT